MHLLLSNPLLIILSTTPSVTEHSQPMTPLIGQLPGRGGDPQARMFVQIRAKSCVPMAMPHENAACIPVAVPDDNAARGTCVLAPACWDRESFFHVSTRLSQFEAAGVALHMSLCVAKAQSRGSPFYDGRRRCSWHQDD